MDLDYVRHHVSRSEMPRVPYERQMGHLINKLNQRVGVTKSALPSTAIMFASRARFRKYAYAPLSSIN